MCQGNLEKNMLEELCPELYNGDSIKTVDTSLMQKSLQCHTCIGTNSTNLTMSTSHIDENNHLAFETTYNPTAFNRVWGCVTGHVSEPLSTGAIVGIIVGCLFIIAGLVVGLFFLIRWQKSRTLQQNTIKVQNIVKQQVPSPNINL